MFDNKHTQDAIWVVDCICKFHTGATIHQRNRYFLMDGHLFLVFLFSTILLRILFTKSESEFGLDSVKLSIQCANPNRESSFDVDCEMDRSIALVMVDDSSDGIATL